MNIGLVDADLPTAEELQEMADAAPLTPMEEALSPLVNLIRDPLKPEYNRSAYIKRLRRACAQVMAYERAAEHVDTHLRTYMQHLQAMFSEHAPLYVPHGDWRLTYNGFVERVRIWAQDQLIHAELFRDFVSRHEGLPLEMNLEVWEYQAPFIPDLMSSPIEVVLGVPFSRWLTCAIDSYRRFEAHHETDSVYGIYDVEAQLDYVFNSQGNLQFEDFDFSMSLLDLLEFVDNPVLQEVIENQNRVDLAYFFGFWSDEDLDEPLINLERGSAVRETLESIERKFADSAFNPFGQAVVVYNPDDDEEEETAVVPLSEQIPGYEPPAGQGQSMFTQDEWDTMAPPGDY